MFVHNEQGLVTGRQLVKGANGGSKDEMVGVSYGSKEYFLCFLILG